MWNGRCTLRSTAPRPDTGPSPEIRFPRLDFTFKAVSRCNLNCSYCYVYNKGDQSWRGRPSVMSDHVFAAALARIRDYILLSGQSSVEIAFHGGEPCLMGPIRFANWCSEARELLSDIAVVDFSIQTNGTLVDDSWIEVFQRFKVVVGVSVDGPRPLHDLYRVDKRGHGTYNHVARGVAELNRGGIEVGLLCVVQLGADGLEVHRSLLELGTNQVTYLLPHFSHDTVGSLHATYGPTPCADYLLPILDEWWHSGTIDQQISIFWQMGRLIMGGTSGFDLFGNMPLGFVFIESDGAIEGLDTLRVGQQGLAQTGLNVLSDSIASIKQRSDLHRQTIFDGIPLPATCRDCPEEMTCAGGHLADRFSRARGFDNRSVWCEDLLLLFGHLRRLMGVTPQETRLRQQALHELSGAGLGAWIGGVR